MIQPGHGASFTLEPLTHFGASRKMLGKNLDRNRALAPIPPAPMEEVIS